MVQTLLKYNQRTIWLYFGIVFISTLLASLSQSKKLYLCKNEYRRNHKPSMYIASFFNTAFFAVFTNVGADRASYKYFFSTASLDRVFHGSEPGYELLQYIFHLATDSSELFLGIISFWTIYNVYNGIWKFRNQLSVGLAIFIFTSQYYFQSYSLIRMYFAISFLVRFGELIKREKKLKYFLVILLASLIHYSMLFVGIGFVIYVFLNKSKKFLSIKVSLLTLLVIGFSIWGAGLAGRLLQFTDNAVIYKYSLYLTQIEVGNIGFKWIFDIFPYALILVYRKYFREEKHYITFSAGYMILGIAISLLSYSVPVIGRGLTTLNLPILLILPMAYEQYRKYDLIQPQNGMAISFNSFTIKINYIIMKSLFILWCIVSMLIYLSGYMSIDAIDNYCFIWSQ